MRQGRTPLRIALGTLALVVGVMGPPARAALTLPDELWGHRVAPILLLSRADVRAALHLKPEQAAEAEREIATIHARAAQLRHRKDAAAVDLRRAVDDEQRQWLETKLTDEQADRLLEIELQWEGIAAVATRPNIAATLSLSDDQKQNLSRLVAERAAHRVRVPSDPSSQEQAERQFTQRVEAILDDGQRRRWERMLGAPFTLTPTSPTGHARR